MKIDTLKNIKLGEIIAIEKGKKAEAVFEDYKDGLKRYLQIDDLRTNDNLKYTNENDGTEVDENDVIIAWDGANAGTVGFGLKGIIGSTLAKLSINSKLILPNFLGKYLQTQFSYIRNLCTGAAIPHVSKNVLMNIKVPIFPISDQKRIVAILDKADALRQKRQQALALLDELLRSTFLEMFGDPMKNPRNWNIHNIGKECSVTKLAGFEYTKYVKYSDEGEVIVIRGLNIKEGRLKLDNIHYIDKKTSDLLIRSKLFKNDVVMTYIGVNIGDVAIIDSSNKYHLAPNVAKITPKNFDKLNSIYLMRCLEFNRIQFKKYTTNTAKQALNMGNIRQLKIPIPPIELQTQFAKIVEQTEAAKASMQQSLQEVENQFQALMQRAFKGEL